MTSRAFSVMAACLLMGSWVSVASSQLSSAPPEPTDIRIRRLAGLPAETAKGQIKIIDVGHLPLSTMISIAANRTADGWRVSYACAESPGCAKGANHAARDYMLSPQASAEVDRILGVLKEGKEPDGSQPRPEVVGGQLLVSIDHEGFKRDYRRGMRWGAMLGRLEELLSPYEPPILVVSVQMDGQACNPWANGAGGTPAQLAEIARNWPGRQAELRRVIGMTPSCAQDVVATLQRLGFEIEWK